MNLWVEHCPECKTQNATDLGDLNDPTGIDVTGMECRKCGFIMRPDGFEDWEIDEGMDFIDDGQSLDNWIKE